MVYVFLYCNGEAANLQKLNNALNNPDEDYVGVDKGPISSAIASAIEKLFLSTKHQERWRVELIECWPEDEDARSILARAFYKAFRQGRIGELSLNRLDSTNERGQNMLLAIFGMASASDDSHHNPMYLCLLDCIFDHMMMPHLQSWAQNAATFSKLFIRGNCFRWPDTPTTTECIAKVFEQAREKPTDLEFRNVSLIGDMECLQGWRLKSVQIEGSSQVHTLLGLSSMASTLKELVINLHGNEDISLAEMDMGIIALLEDPNCCLEDLELSSEHVETTLILALFQALSNVQSLKCLDISEIDDDNPIICHAMIDYLRSNPPSLKYLSIHEWMIFEIPSAADDICDVLRSENHTLKKFCITNNIFGNPELNASFLPYLVRNRAGRRILLDEQVPPSLMADVLERTQQMEMKDFYDVKAEEAEILRADATYHLVREGLAFLFS